MGDSKAIIKAKTASVTRDAVPRDSMQEQEKTRASIRARPTPQTEKIEIEVTKSANLGPLPDVTIHMRRYAPHTMPGGAQDEALIVALRTEASEMAAAIKQTVPTVTWDWLCKILADEYLETINRAEENMEKVRRHYGGDDRVPGLVKRFHSK